jgi:hypothetical protein
MLPRYPRLPPFAAIKRRPLSLFRDKKVSDKCSVPTIHRTGTSGAFYPALKLQAGVSARPKRATRRLPLFPEGQRWSDVRGDSAGDDAWVIGKYYLGISLFFCMCVMGGVADGVGAWNTKEKGRPGLWARLLMHYWAVECEERMKLWKVDRISGLALDEDEEEVDIVQMLHRAYLRTKIEMENTGGWVGSTTATVGLLQRSNLHIANVSPIFR